jgi:hypothetical protein
MAFQQYPQKGGIPSGNTAARPSGAVIGDTFYNGQNGILEIYDGTQWTPCSSPAGIPTLVVADVGTSRAFTSGAIAYTFTPNSLGGAPLGYTAVATSPTPITYTTGSTSSDTPTLSVAGPAVYEASGTAFNAFGTSPFTSTVSVTVTTVPETRTIGTATASTSANQITVTWTNGANGGKNLSAITITPYLNGTTAETSRTAATTSSTSYTFTQGQLTGNSSYTFKVTATNANGTSIESTATNSATMPNNVIVDYLVIAGGGGGGMGYYGGGGGAGGYRTSAGTSGGNISAESTLGLNISTAYTVTVGGGGAASGSQTGTGTNGGNSVFATITSTGGGGGASRNNTSGGLNGAGGGSGGGAGMPPSTGGAKTASPVQGFDGGSCPSSRYGAGGGGAGAIGPNGNTDPNGLGADGGNGLENSITGTSVFRGGGGAGGGSGSVTRTGGTGGGGTWTGSTLTATAGTTNTGGGGCGGGEPDSDVGGSGGSGIVIIKIPDTFSATFSGGVTQTMSTAVSGFKVYTVTAAGGSDTVTFS